MQKKAFLYGGLPGLLIGMLGGYLSFGLLLYFAEEGVFSVWMIMIPVLCLVFGFLIGIGIFYFFTKRTKS